MPVPVIVVNLGHSVLKSLDDYTDAASEIYSHYRKGQNVVAVMSAQRDATDSLMAEARAVGPEGTARNLPELVHLGERRSAALLALALERIGAPAFVRQARDLGLKAKGPSTEAELVGMNTEQLIEDLKNLGVKALLLKDVDGVYEHDPRGSGPAPKRYSQISWDDAIERAGPLVASKAIQYAKDNSLEFDLGTIGMPIYTAVGPITSEPKVDKYIAEGIAPELLTADFDDVLAAEPDVFIDVSGPIDPGLDFSRQMLSRGVHVVSANKQAIAAGGQALIDYAKEQNTELMFSSAAGGGMPVLEMCLREKGRITRVEALLNGTTNYMLGEISNGVPYADALQAAQDKGFAEADPSGDVDGSDAAAKIRLVALLGFGETIDVDDIPRETIDNFAPNEPSKGAFKRVATCWRDKNGFSSNLEVKNLSKNNFLAQAFIKYAAKAQAVGRRQSRSWRILWIFPAKIFVSF